MKQFYRDFRLSVIVAIIAFSICFLVGKYFLGYQEHIHDPHQWLHEQLNITDEQDENLVPIEEKFSLKKRELGNKILIANKELANAINRDRKYSDRVQTAVDKIHLAQGELQKATLEHLFEMHSVLTPEQSKKLNALTTDALTHNP